LIEIFHSNKPLARLYEDNNRYILQYLQEFSLSDSISISMPSNHKFHISDGYLHPFFEMYIPEGYLFEIFKNIIAKEFGKVTDYLIFSLLANNIEGRITYKTKRSKKIFMPIDYDEIINYDNEDTFKKLLETFLEKNAISGVQPKTIAIVKNKESLQTKEYIIKTWGNEFPNLAENEYFCLRAFKRAGIKTVNATVSKNRRFLLVENFIKDNFGFEEAIVLLGKQRINKYQGSYEQVANTILKYTTDEEFTSKELYKMVVMNCLLKNGDAHLKNFGVIYNDAITEITIAPAYDIVNTIVYIYKDKPALTLFGKKLWFGKKELIEFGEKYCYLNHKDALLLFEESLDALNDTLNELTSYIKENPSFKEIGTKMTDIWRFSLNSYNETFKELPVELIRNWTNDKKVAKRKRLHPRRAL